MEKRTQRQEVAQGVGDQATHLGRVDGEPRLEGVRRLLQRVERVLKLGNDQQRGDLVRTRDGAARGGERRADEHGELSEQRRAEGACGATRREGGRAVRRLLVGRHVRKGREPLHCEGTLGSQLRFERNDRLECEATNAAKAVDGVGGELRDARARGGDERARRVHAHLPQPRRLGCIPSPRSACAQGRRRRLHLRLECGQALLEGGELGVGLDCALPARGGDGGVGRRA